MNSATKVLIEYIADLKRKINRSSYHGSTHDKWTVLNTVLIEYTADLKRKIYRSSYHATTHDK